MADESVYIDAIETEFQKIEYSKAWNQIYQKVRSDGAYDFPLLEARNPANRQLNRYRDVLPYDHSRIVLEHPTTNYINASLVKVESINRQYILTQGPLSSTSPHFWLMVWQKNCKGIVMLNKVIEKNTVKCDQYWPLGSQNGGQDEVHFNTVGLSVQFVSEVKHHHYIYRTLRLTELSSGNSREVLHFHFITWPDFGVPQSPEAFSKFLSVVIKSGSLEPGVGPPIVHCSAGIGRSGTFCLVDSILVMLERGLCTEKIGTVLEVLLDMRRYRMGLIQTPEQLRFSYQAIIYGARQRLSRRLNNNFANGSLISSSVVPTPCTLITSESALDARSELILSPPPLNEPLNLPPPRTESYTLPPATHTESFSLLSPPRTELKSSLEDVCRSVVAVNQEDNTKEESLVSSANSSLFNSSPVADTNKDNERLSEVNFSCQYEQQTESSGDGVAVNRISVDQCSSVLVDCIGSEGSLLSDQLCRNVQDNGMNGSVEEDLSSSSDEGEEEEAPPPLPPPRVDSLSRSEASSQLNGDGGDSEDTNSDEDEDDISPPPPPPRPVSQPSSVPDKDETPPPRPPPVVSSVPQKNGNTDAEERPTSPESLATNVATEVRRRRQKERREALSSLVADMKDRHREHELRQERKRSGDASLYQHQTFRSKRPKTT